jgi:hypothetical protein
MHAQRECGWVAVTVVGRKVGHSGRSGMGGRSRGLGPCGRWRRVWSSSRRRFLAAVERRCRNSEGCRPTQQCGGDGGGSSWARDCARRAHTRYTGHAVSERLIDTGRHSGVPAWVVHSPPSAPALSSATRRSRRARSGCAGGCAGFPAAAPVPWHPESSPTPCPPPPRHPHRRRRCHRRPRRHQPAPRHGPATSRPTYRRNRPV